MDSSYLTNPLVFLVQTLFGLYILVVMLRFLLQWVRADFYNPISQFLVKATNPPLRPLRRVIPGFRGIDFASVVLMWGLKTIELMLVTLFTSGSITLLLPLLLAIPELVSLLLNVFLFAILIQVIISWINPGSYNPATTLLYSLTEPVLRPIRRRLPAADGLDFSPLVAMIVLVLLKKLLLPVLQVLSQSPLR